jgi:SAM-dependent methyltransferase
VNKFTCRACRNKEFSEEIVCKDFYSGNLGQQHVYAVCAYCNSLSISKFFDAGEEIYNEGYYSLDISGLKHGLKDFFYKILFNVSYHVGIHFLAAREYLLYREFRKLRVAKGAAIVDIGCGGGKFLKRLQFLGYENVSGIDPFFKESDGNDQSLNIRKKSIHNLDGFYDVIVAHHVIEHVNSPISFMADVARLLSESGKALVCFPTYGGVTKVFKEHSYIVQAPQHACLISASGFLKICQDSGLKVCTAVRSSESDLN